MDEQAATSKIISTPSVITGVTAGPSSDKQHKPPSTLFLGPSPFYRNVSGRLSLNDRHLQHNRSRTAGTSATVSDSSTWSQGVAWRPGNGISSNGPVQAAPRRVANSSPSSAASPFPFYTKPEPIVLGTSSQLHSTASSVGIAPRRPHSVAATPTAPATGLSPYSWCSADSSCLQTGPRRPHSIASSPVSSKGPGVPSARPRDGPVALSSSYGILHQPIPRRPHSIGTSIAITPPTPSVPSTRTENIPQQQIPRRPLIPSSSSVPILPSATSSPKAKLGNSMQQHTPRRPQSVVVTPSSSATLPHVTTATPSCVSMITTGSSHTWSSSNNQQRRVATTAATPTSVPVTLSPSDSGYRSLPPATSDYQILNSSHVTHNSTTRRLSLPSTSAQVALGLQTPRPSPTFHGLPFLPVRPLTCGLSPNGNPIFLGCTHLHTPNSKTNTPATTPSNTVASTAQALQQLLLQHPRNGFRTLDDKVNLFLEILDTQERFEQVRHLSSCSSWIVVTCLDIYFQLYALFVAWCAVRGGGRAGNGERRYLITVAHQHASVSEAH